LLIIEEKKGRIVHKTDAVVIMVQKSSAWLVAQSKQRDLESQCETKEKTDLDLGKRWCQEPYPQESAISEGYCFMHILCPP